MNTSTDQRIKEALLALVSVYANSSMDIHKPVDVPAITKAFEEAQQQLAALVAEARIDELKTLMAKHSRTYKQTVTDSNGGVYVDDSHSYISKYETQERIKELKAQLKEK